MKRKTQEEFRNALIVLTENPREPTDKLSIFVTVEVSNTEKMNTSYNSNKNYKTLGINTTKDA